MDVLCRLNITREEDFMSFGYEAIKRDILRILNERFSIEVNSSDCSRNIFLLGGRFNDVSMVYLVYILEDHFNTVFNETDFLRDDFFCVDSLAKYLLEKLQS